MIVLGLQMPPFYNKDWGIHETSQPRAYRVAHNSYFVEGVEVEELWTNSKTDEQKVVTRRLYSTRIRHRDRSKYPKKEQADAEVSDSSDD